MLGIGDDGIDIEPLLPPVPCPLGPAPPEKEVPCRLALIGCDDPDADDDDDVAAAAAACFEDVLGTRLRRNDVYGEVRAVRVMCSCAYSRTPMSWWPASSEIFRAVLPSCEIGMIPVLESWLG